VAELTLDSILWKRRWRRFGIAYARKVLGAAGVVFPLTVKKRLARVHPRFRTPHVTTILTGVVVAACSMFTSIDEMVDLTNIGTLFAFILVCIGILILRKRDPNRPRAFRTPWSPVVPMLGVISCAYLMLGLPWVTWLRFALWLLLGLVIYFSVAYAILRGTLL